MESLHSASKITAFEPWSAGRARMAKGVHQGGIMSPPPNPECRGSDTGADGTGEVRQPRIYQLVRQKGSIKDVTFEIEFLDPGAQVFSFTFG